MFDVRRRDFVMVLGAAAAWPLSALAQRPVGPVRIGFMPLGSPSSSADLALVHALRNGIRDADLVDRQDFALDIVWVAEESEYPNSVSGLLARGAKVLVSAGTSATVAAKRQTSTIPVVFINVGNPIGVGLVESLAHPGANITGFSDVLADLSSKFVGLARELGDPRAPIDYLWHTKWADGRNRFEATQRAAEAAGVALRSRPLSEIAELEDQIALMKSDRATVAIVQPGPFTHRFRKQIIHTATNNGVATIFGFPPIAEDGALIAYGPDPTDMYHGAGLYVGRIIKGEKTADLPVQQPTRFELVINLKTAKALGLEVPPTLLASADEVIE
jgi:putative ABC transport system substrate-binding protein